MKDAKSQEAIPLRIGFAEGSVWIFLAGIPPVVWVILALAAAAVLSGIVIDRNCRNDRRIDREVQLLDNENARVNMRQMVPGCMYCAVYYE